MVAPLDRPLSKIAVYWRELDAPTSALRWGSFAPIFELKEVGESTVLEPFARETMAKGPRLRTEFERRVRADPRFAANPDARLSLFYDRSPWALAQRVGEYPVDRPRSVGGLPL